MPGIYAAGDVVNSGPASIVKAAAAGEAIANSILGRRSQKNDRKTPLPDVTKLLRDRSHRERRTIAPTIPVESRDQDTEVMLTYSEQQARAEAQRCLECHSYCSICVGVCPNLALQTYRTDEPGKQPFQVAVIADLCNECGNCTTFCPTSGRPYRDKPRLYLNREDFQAQQDNAFMVHIENGNWVMDARFDGGSYRIESGGDCDNSAQSTTMHMLLNGLRQSMAFLPTALAKETAAAGKIAHPGYQE